MRRLLRRLIVWALGADPIWWQSTAIAIEAQTEALNEHTEAVNELTEQQKRAAALARKFPSAGGLGGLDRY